MKKTDLLITQAAVALVAILLILLVVRYTQRVYRSTDTPLAIVEMNASVSSAPEGLVVSLNAPAEQAKKHLLLNYVDPSGEAIRTRRIPNATASTAGFQVVQDDVYVYTEQGDEPGLRRMDEGGSLTAMADIQRGLSGDTFWLASSDGSLVAWSETTFADSVTTSTLYQAQVDGSHQTELAQVTEVGDFYLRPLAWVKNEVDEWEVWYVRQPVGLGGYVLYGDPVGPVYTDTRVALDHTGPVMDLSEDGLIFSFLDHTEESGLVAHVIDFSLPLVGAGQAGEGKLSPDHSTLAISAAAGNPESESGWVEIWSVSSQTAVRVVPDDPSQILRVVGWLNDETVALSIIHADNIYQSEIFLVKKDGSFYRKIWTGFPIGVVPAP